MVVVVGVGVGVVARGGGVVLVGIHNLNREREGFRRDLKCVCVCGIAFPKVDEMSSLK